jgi:hypothetical protein
MMEHIRQLGVEVIHLVEKLASLVMGSWEPNSSWPW